MKKQIVTDFYECPKTETSAQQYEGEYLVPVIPSDHGTIDSAERVIQLPFQYSMTPFNRFSGNEQNIYFQGFSEEEYTCYNNRFICWYITIAGKNMISVYNRMRLRLSLGYKIPVLFLYEECK